jgi:hypothetical protein
MFPIRTKPHIGSIYARPPPKQRVKANELSSRLFWLLLFVYDYIFSVCLAILCVSVYVCIGVLHIPSIK